MMMQNVAERLQAHSHVAETGCRLWDGAVVRRYGAIQVDGKLRRAHRVAYELANGPIPEGMYVCHSCDNPLCIEASHLWLGTADDNAKDCIAKGRTTKGRMTGPVKIGVDSPRAKLNDAAVAAIRARHAGGDSAAVLAREYGVATSTIHRAVSRKFWTHVA